MALSTARSGHGGRSRTIPVLLLVLWPAPDNVSLPAPTRKHPPSSGATMGDRGSIGGAQNFYPPDPEYLAEAGDSETRIPAL